MFSRGYFSDIACDSSAKKRLALAPLGALRQSPVVTCKVPVFDPERRGTLASLGCEICEMEANGVLE